MCLGIITCYEQKLLTYEQAMLWLFNNNALKYLNKNKVNSNIITSIEYGTELWGVEKTDLYEKTIMDIKKLCTDFLASIEVKRVGKEYIQFE
jgi:hypothetical protein